MQHSLPPISGPLFLNLNQNFKTDTVGEVQFFIEAHQLRCGMFTGVRPEENRYFSIDGIAQAADARALQRMPELVELLAKVVAVKDAGAPFSEQDYDQARDLWCYIMSDVSKGQPALTTAASTFACEQEELDYLAAIGDFAEGV